MKKDKERITVAFKCDGENMLIVSDSRDGESRSNHNERIAMMMIKMIDQNEKSKDK